MNDKVKSLFFSQYWGQCVVQVSGGLANNRQPVTGQLLEKMSQFDKPYLLLRDISQLTDEERITVVNIIYSDYLSDKKKLEYIRFQIIRYSNFTNLRNKYGYEIKIWDDGSIFYRAEFQKTILPAYDYLRSIGILTTFTYLSETNQPITLTPAEIIELGWAKYKENEQ